MKSFNWPSFAFIVALATALVGCGTPQYVHHHYEPRFLPETADSAKPAVCRVVLTQDDPFVASKVTQAEPISTAVGIDLVGRLMDAAYNAVDKEAHDVANKDRQDKATKMGAPLVGHGLGAAFRNDFQSSLSAVLASSPWLHTAPLEMTSGGSKRVMVTEINQHPVIQINLIYHLSYDASALIMQAHLVYFRQGQTNAFHSRYYTYYSEPVGLERDDAAVAKWVASDQDLLRRRMNEGMSDLIAMLERDFFRPEPMETTNSSVRISCYDVLTLAHVQWEGHILSKGISRILFQEKSGNYFSIVPD